MEAWRYHHVRGRSDAAFDVAPPFAAVIPGDQFYDVSVAEIERSGMRPATGAAALRMSRSRSGCHPQGSAPPARASLIVWGSKISIRLFCGQLRSDVILVGEPVKYLLPADPVHGEVDRFWPSTSQSLWAAAG